MNPKKLTPTLTARDFWRASRGFSLVWVAHLGRRHGLLVALAASRAGLSVPALAARGRRDRGAVALWCEAAHALGLLQIAGARYKLPRSLVPLLVAEESPAYLGGHLDYLALRSLDFEGFDELFRFGARSARSQRHLVEAFEEATKWDHTAFLEALLPRAPAVRRALLRGADVLDVGAGAGAWDFRLAREFPRSRFVGLEHDPTALRAARSQSARKGLGERVHFELGAAERMRFEERFDLVYLGEVLCAAKDARAVLANCRRALKPGGKLVVAEGLIDRRLSPRDGANAIVLAMQLEFALQAARFFTKAELSRDLGRAGFKRARFVPAGGGLHFALATR